MSWAVNKPGGLTPVDKAGFVKRWTKSAIERGAEGTCRGDILYDLPLDSRFPGCVKSPVNHCRWDELASFRHLMRLRGKNFGMAA